eukprot:COSAG02_NODE_9504_length_2195_cov_1.544847_1_plen_147_part_00
MRAEVFVLLDEGDEMLTSDACEAASCLLAICAVRPIGHLTRVCLCQARLKYSRAQRVATRLSEEHYDLLTLLQWRLFQVQLCLGVLQLPSEEARHSCDIVELEDRELMQDFEVAVSPQYVSLAPTSQSPNILHIVSAQISCLLANL